MVITTIDPLGVVVLCGKLHYSAVDLEGHACVVNVFHNFFTMIFMKNRSVFFYFSVFSKIDFSYRHFADITSRRDDKLIVSNTDSDSNHWICSKLYPYFIHFCVDFKRMHVLKFFTLS